MAKWGLSRNVRLVQHSGSFAFALWCECKLVHPLWNTVCKFLKKLKLELPYDPAIPLLGIYPKKMKSLPQRDICTPMFFAALFTIAKTWKQPKCTSMDEWIYMCVYI